MTVPPPKITDIGWKNLLPATFLLMSTVTVEVFLLPNRLNPLFLSILVIGTLGCIFYPIKCFFQFKSIYIISIMIIFFVYDSINIRLTSFFYTIALICSLSFYKSFLQESDFQYDFFLATLRLIVYLFGIVGLIQFLCYMLSLPIFNRIPHSEFIAIEDDVSRFPSLSYEPAHYSKIIALCLFAYTIVYNIFKNEPMIEVFKRNALFYSMGIIQMVFMKSSTSIVLCILLLYLFLSKKSFIILLSGFVIIVSIVMIGFRDNVFIDRVYQTFDALVSFNLYNIIYADSSAAVRIAPYFIFFQNINWGDPRFWFGHGFDASFDFFRDEVNWYRDYIPAEVGIGGFFVSTAFNYGIIFSISFFCWLKEICLDKGNLFYFIFYFIVCYDMGFNTYIVCFASLIFISISHYSSISQAQQQELEISQ